jgi:RNA polymerase sigma factor (TIGR02999 family)
MTESLAHPAEPDGTDARHRLFALLYDELRRIARRELQRAVGVTTLSPTTLLHEVYLNLHKREGVSFPDRAHFLAYACRAMRGLMIDYARSRQALKRGAAFEITSLKVEQHDQAVEPEELQRLGDAIDRLAAINPRLAQVVDLKYFSGFSFGDIAQMWGMSQRTIQRDWDKARLFLSRALAEPGARNLEKDLSVTSAP